MAFGGLTKKDVKLVEFSSYGAMWKGIVNNEVDAAIESTISGQVEGSRNLAARDHLSAHTRSRQGRLGAACTSSAPTSYPLKATCGGGLSRRAPVELPSYPYPIFMAYAIAAGRS